MNVWPFTSILRMKKLFSLKYESIGKNLNFEQLIKTEMPEFYKRENEKGRISKTLEYYKEMENHLEV